MNWITNYVRPRINSMLGRREVPENLWIKCPETGEMVFHKDLEGNKWVIPASGYHMKMPAKARLADLFDNGEFESLPQPKVAQDPLKFRDSKKYSDRLRDSRLKTEQEDTILAGVGKVQGLKLVAVVHEFNFIGGSLGMAAGEAIVKAFERATAEKCPLVMFPASGGARMQEGILSLMQLPRTTVAVDMLKESGQPYIVVLTNPTTGGVTASYAMLGDIHLAEPGAEIGFAGKRVIEQTLREKLPEGFQTSEYLLEHGMVDMVVKRHDIPETLARLLKILTKKPVSAANDMNSGAIALAASA
ncbi:MULTISPECIES: acetyl-CoA carboxylase, carboxyltransferase subunit beta [Rhizobium]|uniref:Acetyl-coenzyme A carboxylase carboxyl transferase subunit beta n=1 Tax=Rhizobium leguminosarum bv. trifolii (strain WSM1325) TaxID=395491 RepID=ACCD_RHILS|nr:acetyl-CoA carboxylase, carboxyltransferase subunit beta [Rhizobium leguminosarum]C6B119.1 RecName: Full=Acetyl-coenzyme A carboxylase carboxyl transferase subunit beta; Short=ACCase subunit beta; Short=Acetyl-CoA carboxylase carboxyltransferase subunit beta [Rhizobium leguminosarum bv. trifolii WSM1325]ACS58523.1 acetyl-CoA carboxylase, carboxyl transferase, beta subunit [Rhizobium leguminosarum bv. trifolii WSM1325]MBY2911186.1 acetyl-CoA carboxylase carboxyltransferase subunit beta [Rhizob